MKYQIKKNLEEQNIGDEIVVFNIESFKFYELNKTMSLLWSQLQQPRTKKELVTTFCKEFEIDKTTAEKDITRALEQLQERNLISVQK